MATLSSSCRKKGFLSIRRLASHKVRSWKRPVLSNISYLFIKTDSNTGAECMHFCTGVFQSPCAWPTRGVDHASGGCRDSSKDMGGAASGQTRGAAAASHCVNCEAARGRFLHRHHHTPTGNTHTHISQVHTQVKATTVRILETEIDIFGQHSKWAV